MKIININQSNPEQEIIDEATKVLKTGIIRSMEPPAHIASVGQAKDG